MEAVTWPINLEPPDLFIVIILTSSIGTVTISHLWNLYHFVNVLVKFEHIIISLSMQTYFPFLEELDEATERGHDSGPNTASECAVPIS